MGTVETHADRARAKIRDDNDDLFTDAKRLAMMDDICEDIYTVLCHVESNLIYGVSSITTVADTMEYTPTFAPHNGFLKNGVWVDGETTYMYQVTEADKVKFDYDNTTAQPVAYYHTEGGDDKVGLLWVPDDAYTVHVHYYKPRTALATYATDNLPFKGIFNQYIQRKLIIEMLEIYEHDISRHALMAEMEWASAMNRVYQLGIRKKRQSSNLFNVGGI